MVKQAKNERTSSEGVEVSSLEAELFAAFEALDKHFREPRVPDRMLRETFGKRRQLLIDLANMPVGKDGSKWFLNKWRPWIGRECAESIDSLRTDLRFIWRGEPISISQLVLDSWLAWRSSDASHPAEGRRLDDARSKARLAAFGGEGVAPKLFTETNTILSSFYRYSHVRCLLADRKLVFNGIDVRTMLIQGVFEHLDHFKVCENDGCAAPFYIAKRSDQLVCSAESCKVEKQREYARNWWNENRAKTQDSTKSRTKKGRAGNGTRKTR